MDPGDVLAAFFLFVAAVVAGCLIGCMSESSLSRTRFEQEAIGNGAATYKLDGEGKSVFKWKEPASCDTPSKQ